MDTSVVRVHVVEPGRVHDGFPYRLGDVSAAWPVAAFAADVPFRNGLGADVVIHRMTTVA